LPVIDLENTDTQRIGRMGELVVELELIARGWHVGNFNASTGNSAGWDIFAAREGRSVKIRVKAKRPGIDCFRWSGKGNRRILLNLDDNDLTDFVAAVSFEEDGTEAVYILPSIVVERALARDRIDYLAIPKRDGTPRKDTNQRNLHLNDDMARPGHGYRVRWREYESAWASLMEGTDRT